MNLVKICLGTLTAISVFTLAGCASPNLYPDGKAWADGWRRGTVTSINDELRWYQRAGCGKSAASGDRFVSVSYRVSGQTRWKHIPMPGPNSPAPRSKVLLNVNSCELTPDR